MNNYIQIKLDEITHQNLTLMGVDVTTIEIMSWMSNYIPQKIMTYDFLSIP